MAVAEAVPPPIFSSTRRGRMGAEVVAMRWIAIAAGVLLVASLVGSEEQAAEEESPLIYTLEVNGQPHPIKPGKLLTLPAQEGPVKVLLKVAPYRIFKIPGLEFRFPRRWHLERFDDEEEELWFLDRRGFRFGVWVQREGEPFILKGDPGAKVTLNDRSLRLAGHEVAGTTLHGGSHRKVTTYYALRTGPDTVLFTLSEMRDDGPSGEPSKEWKEMERWLQESLKVLPASGDK